ncbi:MAG: DUF504 domain-containing protein [Nitrososphaerota archaeon]|jgi:uncharacterized protein (UPF0248 family)|nr:DUF504 domain-containing protein [Nitrososphaerota archaeon]MDG6924071.1 DUF504 domain-containing protein [Nitrososphaerota archaeon]
MGRRKGSLKETLSYALHGDDPKLFSVSYRDKEKIRTDALEDFVTKVEFSEIPLTRIVRIMREDEVVWERGQHQIKVKEKRSFV